MRGANFLGRFIGWGDRGIILLHDGVKRVDDADGDDAGCLSARQTVQWLDRFCVEKETAYSTLIDDVT